MSCALHGKIFAILANSQIFSATAMAMIIYGTLCVLVLLELYFFVPYINIFNNTKKKETIFELYGLPSWLFHHCCSHTGLLSRELFQLLCLSCKLAALEYFSSRSRTITYVSDLGLKVRKQRKGP